VLQYRYVVGNGNIFNFVSQLLKRQFIMATEKLFSVAGTATNPDGTTKARFANDFVARVKILSKAGCTNINLVELPHAMTKLDALKYLTEQGITEGEAGYAVSNKLAEKSKEGRKSEVSMTLKTGSVKSKSTKPAVTAEQVLAAVGEATV
jgi:hypothetical protein